MIGLSKELEAELAARGFSDADVARLFGPRSHMGELRVVYQRGDQVGDLTAPLPSSRHMQYVARGWTAVAPETPQSQTKTEPVEVPAEIAEHAKKDRRAHYRRGNDEAIFSTKHHSQLAAKGFEFAGLADEERLRRLAEAKPVAKNK